MPTPEEAVSNWTLRATLPAGAGQTTNDSPKAICWCPELAVFVGFYNREAANTDKVIRSVDGINWTISAAPTGTNWIGIAWSPTLNLFAAVSKGGSLATSPDGLVWTIRSYPFGTDLNSICWSSGLAKFFAVGGNGVKSSADGITWAHVGLTGPTDIVWANGISKLVATLTSGRLAHSPTGATWTLTADFGASTNSIAWSEELSLLVALKSVSGTVSIITSPDAINWTHRAYPAINSPQGVVWSPELALFVVVANESDPAGGLGRILSSPDGINWTLRNVPNDVGAATGRYFSVAWSPELGMCAALTTYHGITSSCYLITSEPYFDIVAPVVNAGADQLLVDEYITTLEGSVTDINDPPLTVTSLWTKISGIGDVVFADDTDPETEVTFSSSGIYVLRLTGTNSEDFSAHDEVTITIYGPPTVDAGPDADALLSETYTLQGSASNDAFCPTPLILLWTKVSGPGNALFTDSDSATSEVLFTQAGRYVLRLTATACTIVYSEVTITVLDYCALPSDDPVLTSASVVNPVLTESSGDDPDVTCVATSSDPSLPESTTPDPDLSEC